MPVFDQLGDPVCPDCLCEHHEAAYAEFETVQGAFSTPTVEDNFADGATIAQVQITTTETCCIVVNAALVGLYIHDPTDIEIERPVGTIKTTQEDFVAISQLRLFHHAAWEVLPAGTYTYFLVNHSGGNLTVNGAWLKAIASDCEG